MISDIKYQIYVVLHIFASFLVSLIILVCNIIAYSVSENSRGRGERKHFFASAINYNLKL